MNFILLEFAICLHKFTPFILIAALTD